MSDETYVYVAETADGKRKKGSLKAATQSKAYQDLVAQGLRPVEIKHKVETFMEKDIQIPGLEKKAKLKDLVVFTKQFALLIKSGMPMLEAIEVSSGQTEDKVLKKALKAVYFDVERGLSLSVAMRKHPAAFPGLLTSVVKVGEEGGFLDKSMGSMSKTYATELELSQRIRSAMTYPLIVVGVAGLVLTGMMIFIIPMFAELFESMDAPIPVPTQILIAISNNSLWVIPLAVVLIMGIVFFFKFFKDEEWLRLKVDKFKMKAPVFGSIYTKTAIARWARNLSMMLNAGVPLTSALRLVAETADNIHMDISTERAVESMENGAQLSKAIDQFDMFPLMVKQMISVGERSGALSPMLDSVADFYEGEVKESSEKLEKSLEPILLVVLGVIVGGMLFALYLPMFSLFAKVAEG